MPIVRSRYDFHAKVTRSEHTACYVCQQFIREFPFVYLVWPADYIYMHVECAKRVAGELLVDLDKLGVINTTPKPLPKPTIVDSN